MMKRTNGIVSRRIGKRVGVMTAAALLWSSAAWGTHVVPDVSGPHCEATASLPVRCAVWAARHSAGGDEVGAVVKTSPDGQTVYSAGFQILGPGHILAYDAKTGSPVWSHTVPDAAVMDLVANDQAVFGAVDEPNYKHSLIALDAASGNVLLSRTRDDSGGFFIAGSLHREFVRLSPDNNVVYFARSVGRSTPEGSDFGVEAFDAATGNLIWSARYNGGRDIISGFTLSPDGDAMFVTGLTGDHNGPNSYDWGIVALRAADGEELWSANYHQEAVDVPWSVAVSPDGTRIAVTGKTGEYEKGLLASLGVETPLLPPCPPSPRCYDLDVKSYDTYLMTIVIDADTGTELWRYDADPGFGIEARAVTFSADGSQVLSAGSNGMSYVTISNDSESGVLEWTALHDEGTGSLGRSRAFAIDTSPDGSLVYVTGESGFRIDTVAYDTDAGDQVWLSRYERHGDVAYDLVVGPDGKVYVTGWSDEDDWADMITLSYP